GTIQNPLSFQTDRIIICLPDRFEGIQSELAGDLQTVFVAPRRPIVSDLLHAVDPQFADPGEAVPYPLTGCRQAIGVPLARRPGRIQDPSPGLLRGIQGCPAHSLPVFLGDYLSMDISDNPKGDQANKAKDIFDPFR